MRGRKRVSAAHKANTMKKRDGLFLELGEEPRAEPSTLHVLAMPNLYGDIVSNLCAGLIGGLRLTPSGNITDKVLASVEAVHITAPDVAGKNMANPTAMLLTNVMMLHHHKLSDCADRIHNAVLTTILAGRSLTSDLGAKSTATDYTKALIDHL